MAEAYLIQKSTAEDLAAAIKEKTGETGTIKGEDFAEKVRGISTGIDVKSIIDIKSNITSVEKSMFTSCYSLHSISFPNAISIGDSSFSDCANMVEIDLPEVTNIGKGAFFACNNLTTITLPKVVTFGERAFERCNKLITVDLTAVEVLSSAFSYCSSLRTIIIRNESSVPTLSAMGIYDNYHFDGTFNNAYNPDALKDGYIYVPAALVDSYKTAENWSTFADQFRALEDYTVDGTITGALDETKINATT